MKRVCTGASIVRVVATGLAAIVLGAGVALAQTPPATPPANPPASPAREPTLDELLGIKPESPAPAEKEPADQPPDPSRAALDRDLSEAEVSEAFEQAVGLMGQTAQRLVGPTRPDAGLETQRLQEDILRKLDKLIDSAEKNAQQKQRKSRQKNSQQDQQQQQQQQNQQSSQAQSQSKRQKPSEQAGSEAGQGAARQDGAVGAGLGGATANWGNLPEHVREALTEGRSDRFSSLYRAMTQEYYKRLAEDRARGTSNAGGGRRP
jgi:type IV secretory pathway VirB10-like protein